MRDAAEAMVNGGWEGLLVPISSVNKVGHVDHGDLGALPGEVLHHRLADAVAAARHEGHAAFDVHGNRPLNGGGVPDQSCLGQDTLSLFQ